MKNNQSAIAECPNDILDELQALVAKAEKIVAKSLKSDTGIASTIKEQYQDSREHLVEMYSDAKDQIVAGAKSTDKAIHAKPYQSLAIAAGVGILIGVVAGRSTCSGK